MDQESIEGKHMRMVSLLVKAGSQIKDELTPEKCNLWHMATGIAGEAGELLDAVKKNVAYNKPLDRNNVIEELGDLEFYMQGLRAELGISRESTLEHNHHKLMTKRYPNGFSNEAAIARADKVEEKKTRVQLSRENIYVDAIVYDITGEEYIVTGLPNDAGFFKGTRTRCEDSFDLDITCGFTISVN